MGIPHDWAIKKLSEVGKFINGCAFKPSDWKKSGIPIVRIQNLNDTQAEFNYFDGDIDKKYILDDGDLLLSWSASLGVYLWQGGKAVLNQHIFKVIPEEVVDKLFLFYMLHKTIEILKRRVHGSTMRHFKKRELDATEIALPPLQEQQKIASILSTADDAIQKTDAIIAKTEELKKGLMQELLTRGIGHTRFKKTEIGEIPEEWDTKKLGEISINKPEYGANVPAIDHSQDLPRYVRITDITTNGKLSEDEPKSIKSEDAINYILKEGDLVFARSGATVGKTYLYRSSDGLCAFAGYLIRFKPNTKIIQPDFLFYYTHSDYYYTWVKQKLRPTAQPNINAKEYATLNLPVPTLSEQRKISDILYTADKKIEIERQRKEKLNKLKKGLMQVLLTGKIRVKIGDDA